MTTDLEQRLRDYGNDLDLAVQRRLHSPPQVPRPGRRRRWLLPATVLAAAVCIAGLVVVVRRPPAPAAPASSGPAPSATEAAVPARPVAPLGSWTATAPSPLSPRADASAVWTGHEVIVWGGHSGNLYYSDGAAYDPAADTWRRISPNPWAGPGRMSVWTGAEMVVLDKNSGAVYNPATDSWSDIPRLASETDGSAWGFEQVAWTGTQVIGVGPRYNANHDLVLGIASWTIGAQAWTELPTLDQPVLDQPVDESLRMTYADGVVYAWPQAAADVGYRLPVGAAVWEVLPTLPFSGDVWPVTFQNALAVVTDGAVATLSGPTWSTAVFGSVDASAVIAGNASMAVLGTAGAVVLDGATGAQPLAPYNFVPTTGTAATWVGDSMFMWGGDSANGAIWRP